MKRSEFIALTREAEKQEGRTEEMTPLIGIANHKERVIVSRAGAIAFINVQCGQLNGSWDYEELEETRKLFRRVDLV